MKKDDEVTPYHAINMDRQGQVYLLDNAPGVSKRDAAFIDKAGNQGPDDETQRKKRRIICDFNPAIRRRIVCSVPPRVRPC